MVTEIKVQIVISVDKQGRILIPHIVREIMGFKEGDRFKFVAEDGKITLVKIE